MPDFFMTKIENGGCSYIVMTVLIALSGFFELCWINALMPGSPISWVPATSLRTASAEPLPASIFTDSPSALK